MSTDDPTHPPAPAPEGDDGTMQSGARTFGPAERSLGAGDVIGRYSVLGRLGQGGMGAVYAAYDPQLDRRVAIKVLRADLAAGLAATEGHALLLQEARAMARLSHPNVVGVHEVGEHGALVFVAMDFVQGGTLGAWLATLPAPRPWREVLSRFVQAGRGLAAAHAAGLVHRDFKPDNVLLGRDGRVRVSDFGLASPADRDERVALSGTPGYMAPEQYQGRGADERTDVYAFCVALWEGLYGQRPIQGATLDALSAAASEGRLTSPGPEAEARLPRWLRQALVAGLSPRREDRPTLVALLDLLERDRSQVRPRAAAALALAALLAVAGGLHLRAQSTLCQGAGGRWAPAWAPARREAARAAFARRPLAFGAETFERAAAALDAYQAQWTAMTTESCEATHLRGTQSDATGALREVCLERALDQAQALTDLFVQADDGIVERAGEAVRSLPPLSGCADVVALSSRAARPPDAVASQVDALRRRLAGAEAQRSAGRYEAAADAARGVAREAEPLGYPPVLAEALVLAGQAAVSQGRYAAARADLEAAVLAGERAPLGVETLVRAWTQQVLLEARESQFPAARRAGAHARALLTSVVRPEPLLGELELIDGIREFLSGASAAAVPHFEAALALRQKVLGPDSPEVAKTLNNLGAAYSNLEQPDRAIGYVRQAAALAERTLGADHPQLAEPLVNLSKLLRVQGQLGEAERAGRRALAIKEAAYGPWAPPTLNARIHVAFTLACQGHFPEALAMQDATVAAARKNGRESLTALFFQLGGRGQVRHWVGDDRGALDDLVEAAALARKMYGAEGMALGRALMDLALQQVVSGEPGAAETLAQAKAAVAAVPQPSPHFDRMAALVAASLKLARGEDVAATEAQLRALIQALSASTDPAQQHLARDGEAILARPR